MVTPGCFSPNEEDPPAADTASSTNGQSSSETSETHGATTEEPGHTSHGDSSPAASSTGPGGSSSGSDASGTSSGEVAPTCDDGVVNGSETDVDCGGPSCAPCLNGSSCNDGANDCVSMFCGPTGQCEDPRSCNALHAGGVDVSGVYTLDPDGVGGNARFDAYCRMDDDGGWTLIATVDHADQDDLPEPNGWFGSMIDTDKLSSPVPIKNNGLASHGAYRLLGAIEADTLVQFELFAEDDTAQIARWFKRISSPVGFQAWFDDDVEPSLVCSDIGMSQNCSMGVIAHNGDVTSLGGMILSHYGYWAGGAIHMRDDDDGTPYFSGLCSYTFEANDNAWNDDYEAQWGNGLRIWLR